MERLKPGLTHSKSFRVREEHLADRVGSGSLPVLSTPSLAAFMERAAFEMVESLLGEDRTSVGSSLDIRHVAPVPLGGEVRVQARLAAVEGRRLVFWIEAWWGDKLVGYGIHERVVVDKKSFLERVKSRS